MNAWLEKTFKLADNGTTLKKEVLAGITTFFAMCYIIVVNPNMMVNLFGGNTYDASIWNAVFVGGILAAVIGTLLMAFVAKMPFAQAAGMGLNSLFFLSFAVPVTVGGIGMTKDAYGTGLAVILLAGVVFLLLSATGLRKYIATALPDGIKKAIPVGIGLFIAFIGFKNSGLVVGSGATFVDINPFDLWRSTDPKAITAAPVVAFMLGLVLLAVLVKKKVGGAVAISILATSVLFYLLNWSLPTFKGVVSVSSFADWWNNSIGNYRFDLAFASGKMIFSTITLIITFCLVDMFDTIGTLYGTAAQANLMDETGNPIRLNQCMLCDSIATATGALLGTSTVTTYVESSAGIVAGGRTGLTSVVVAVLLLVCLFFSPIATMIPSCATAIALVYVGVCMMKTVASIDFSDITIAIPAFLTFIIMPLTYSIANGIAVGLISYEIIRLVTLKVDKSDIVPAIISLLFLAKFIMNGIS